jgi:hypothetical protein
MLVTYAGEWQWRLRYLSRRKKAKTLFGHPLIKLNTSATRKGLNLARVHFRGINFSGG